VVAQPVVAHPRVDWMPDAAWRRAREALPPDALVAGVDEVGRGPLAGDVVAAAVILPRLGAPSGLADSKKLSARRREALAAALWACDTPIAVGRASPEEIDAINILAASLRAMERAIDALTVQPDLVLVDGRHCPTCVAPIYAVVRGDALVPEIAAASIIAKVQRDGEMDRLHSERPAYGFDRHRGYPTPAHLAALREHGPAPEHRRSFAPVRRLIEDAKHD